MIKKTLQEWFNVAWERAKIPVRAADEAGICILSAKDGVPGCFIGCGLPPDIAKREEGDSAVVSLLDNGVIAVAPTDSDWSFSTAGALEELQGIHDSTPPLQWSDRLRAYANDYGLAVPQ